MPEALSVLYVDTKAGYSYAHSFFVKHYRLCNGKVGGAVVQTD